MVESGHLSWLLPFGKGGGSVTRNFTRLVDFQSKITAQTVNELQQALEDDDTRITSKQDVSTLNSAVASTTVVSRLKDRVFDARDYGASYQAADNIDAINAAIAAAGAAVASNGGTARVVVGSSAKTFLVRPSLAQSRWIKLQSGVVLDLSDVTLKVADDSDAYDNLMTGNLIGTLIENVRVTGGLIDLNGQGHVNANIGVGTANKSHAFGSYHAHHVVFDKVSFNACGINTIVINGTDCYDFIMEDCDITFVQGNGPTADYDNSFAYLVMEEIRIANNRFNAAMSERARGAVEIHGPNATLIGNTTKGFQTLTNLVTPDFPYAGNRNNLTVVGNSVVDGNYGVVLWPQANDTMRNVTVSGNTFHLAQIDWNEPSATGVTVVNASTQTGAVEGLIVTNNVVAFQPGDTRTVDRNGIAISYTSLCGVGLGGYGETRHAIVNSNVVLNCPSYGIRAGHPTSGAALNDAKISSNLLVDCGSNLNLSPKASFGVLGVANFCDIHDNRFHDTGTTVLNGKYSFFVSLTAGSANAITRNRETTKSGVAFTHAVPDTYVSYYTKRVTIDIPSIAAGAAWSIPLTIPGVAVGDAVVMNATTLLEDDLYMYPPTVTQAGIVTAKFRNLNPTTPLDPASRNWDVRVIPREMAVF